MRRFNTEKDAFVSTRTNYLKQMILVVIPLVVLVGLIGVPIYTRATPYWENPTVIPASSFLIISLISYILLLKDHYLPAVHLYAYGFIFAPFAAVLLDSPDSPGLAGLMVGGVIISSVMFNTQRAVYLSSFVTILSVSSLFLILPESSHSALFYTLCVIITLIALILIFKRVNDNLEKKRRLHLTTLNTALKDQTVELEEEIEKRKQIEAELQIAKEKAEESDQLKSAFLASMNHELRTPLNHILGFSALIKDEKPSEKIESYASTVHNSGKNLLAIIEDIFSLAMSENSSVKLRMEKLEVQELMDQLQGILQTALVEAGKEESIKPGLTIDPSLENAEISIDRYKVVQVITNLIFNAVKFTESGSIALEIRSLKGKKIALSVTDTGTGIRKEKQDIIFEFFRQGSHDIHTKFGGLGIGLAISKRIADVIDGDLNVQSEPGAGSRFTLNFSLN